MARRVWVKESTEASVSPWEYRQAQQGCGLHRYEAQIRKKTREGLSWGNRFYCIMNDELRSYWIEKHDVVEQPWPSMF